MTSPPNSRIEYIRGEPTPPSPPVTVGVSLSITELGGEVG